MSQIPRRTLVRQLAESVWPGRTVNGYANLIAARLRKLADEKSTGMLPVSGPGDGVVYFWRGEIVHAESSQTPRAVPRPGALPAGLAALGLVDAPEPSPGPVASGGELVLARSVGRLAAALALTEPIVDAVSDLLSNDSRYAKFRPGDEVFPGVARPLSVEPLLAEVQRRHAVLRQLAPWLTPDTPVARQPMLGPPTAQVTPVQWALLVRAAEPATPRSLALDLGRSVFGTTLEIRRLLELGLLTVPGRPAGHYGDPAASRPGGPPVSFVRAVAGERGTDG